MRFLDAELRAVSPARAFSPLLTAAAVTGMAALFSLASGHGASAMVPLFPTVFLGALMAEAGISPQRSPRAMLAAVPVIGLLVAGASRLTTVFGGA